MNKKEINEIKGLYDTIEECGIARLCGCYVNGDKEKVKVFSESFLNLDEKEQHKYLEIFRKNMSGTSRTVSEMIDYINVHLYENITIEDIASQFYLNHDYAARIFKKHINTTIKQFITIQRMTKAQQLLLEGETITETQINTGYGSYEHFFRT